MNDENTLANRAVMLLIAAAVCWILLPDLIYFWLRWMPTPEWWPVLVTVQGFARMAALGLAVAGVVFLLRIRKVAGP